MKEGVGSREFRWAINCRDCRELLHDVPQLDRHLLHPGPHFLFRFHPDAWTILELSEEHIPLWCDAAWADSLCWEEGRVTYQREPGDDGVGLSAPLGLEAARGLFRLFFRLGRLPEAPGPAWWRDQDEERVDMPRLWAEQEQAWAELRRRFLARLIPLKQRAAGYLAEFSAGRRVCPLCHQKGRVRFHDGGPLRYSSFACEACQRPFAVEDVDRTPQSRVE